MFFKRRVWVPPAWWVRLDERQRVYARRLADWLARKAVKVPVRRLRVYVVLVLLGFAGLDLAVTMGWLRDHRGRNKSVSVGWSAPLEREAGPRPVMGQRMRELLEDIRRDPAKAKVLDSLLKARPGLADTLRMVDDFGN
jgi:hypothetical protein